MLKSLSSIFRLITLIFLNADLITVVLKFPAMELRLSFFTGKVLYFAKYFYLFIFFFFAKQDTVCRPLL
jgi:hypothetical protein